MSSSPTDTTKAIAELPMAPLAIAGSVAAALSAGVLIYRHRHQELPLPRSLRRIAPALLTRAGGQAESAHFKMPVFDGPVLYEKGANGQKMDKRLYCQLYVLDCINAAKLPEAREKLQLELVRRNIPSVIYDDVNSPKTIGLLTWSEDPKHFPTVVNPVLQLEGIGDVLEPRQGWTMLGKTYSSGHEADLEDILLRKVIRTVSMKGAEYAVWYPMRREGKFYKEKPEDQCRRLLEHAAIGRAYGKAGVWDVRLNCYGFDADDNEFIIGLMNKDLHPLSKIVEDMRKTAHSSFFMKSFGPFFVGQRVFVHIPFN
ncbi:hypothetical protein Pmar_PMAR027986 [Perkinsus marinus ATCC 50983]|uniref:Uncharacterized protein n=1 Tax=Perkinsus marinus (strain ATCC 50983 / TXsc) TaxID=423536 RepID=C5LV86_PERM5|nr:hypothetical protein Pmar_PMAR027986 [Perkinsus marinus ATCC 50983]EEQ99324.1 hypothetical protein Pmar_PMAR027986 [Perkinsus marinus ATCC 50983]|eukprot:XP_002766607.1 hypothetical protein Pmar_PMAR027986 [Perkinsus marinus ATCC 50983]